jgi:asparagine synthase (glutamine-hydrolysing)
MVLLKTSAIGQGRQLVPIIDMCGIAAIFAYDPAAPAVDRAELVNIRDAMTARGPDGSGAWFSTDGKAALGHRRLSIIDLSPGGAQPMASQNGARVVTFNGEIYNYRELRARLEQKGCRFQSASDTEVLLHLYAEKGEGMVLDLRGMYAFAIWDAAKQGLFLARDPYGIKPLYYADDGKTFHAASQVKALLGAGAIDTSPEPAGHVGFFLWGHVPEPFTLHRGIRALPAGTSLWVGRDGPGQPRRFCGISEILAQAETSRSPRPDRERLRSSLQDSVRHHLIADAPLGLFLSSGLDSATLTGLAAREGGTLRTVTLGFDEFRGTANDETALAEKVARQYGSVHETVWVTGADFHSRGESLFSAMDQPTIDGVNTYFVSLAARRASLKVALSGLGGDELFGGYPSFHEIPRVVGALGLFRHCGAVGRAARVLSAPLLKRMTSPKYAGLFEYGGAYAGAYLLRRGLFMPWELPGLLDPEMARQGWRDLQPILCLEETLKGLSNPRLKVSALESCWYMRNQLLRDSDWAGMAHSLEIRMPLVDVQLLRQISPLLAGDAPPNKQDMASTPAPRLPDEILHRRKTGFCIPVRQWLLRDAEAPRNPGGLSTNRGLRGWSLAVYARFAGGQLASVKQRKQRRSAKAGSARILVLLSDAFGGWGGIAKFNRDFLAALASHERVEEVVALPRQMPHESEPMPAGLTYVRQAAGGKCAFVLQALKAAREMKKHAHCGPVFTICAHINLLPAAYAARLRLSGPLALVIHGIDAWKPTPSLLANRLAAKADRVISVSEFTRDHFLSWSGVARDRVSILPNSVNPSLFGPGPKAASLLARYKLHDKKVIMTLGRLSAEERYKGFDEVLETMPKLLESMPNLAYLIAGDGLDRARLEQKARQLGLAENVVFAGRVAESEKADHYRLADAYVMPGWGEGFGIVYLEAMACGIPVVGSSIDGSREALRHGELGLLVDPHNPAQIREAIIAALSRPKTVPPGLDYFSLANFQSRVHRIMDEWMGYSDKTSCKAEAPLPAFAQ